jgi:hypothetical protein
MNKFCRKIIFTILLASPLSLPGENTNAPLPSLKFALQQVIQRAKNEGDNERSVKFHYHLIYSSTN